VDAQGFLNTSAVGADPLFHRRPRFIVVPDDGVHPVNMAPAKPRATLDAERSFQAGDPASQSHGSASAFRPNRFRAFWIAFFLRR
jgi:hypothetical protein